jgi:succinate-acetate transporter protein
MDGARAVFRQSAAPDPLGLTGLRTGLLLNFYVAKRRDGIVRMVL